jgi:RNA polymerase sigma factor (sigma-70 family)
MDDAQLLDALARDEPQAQFEFLERYKDWVSEHLLRLKMTGLAEGDIEEIASDILYGIIQAPEKINLSKGSIDAFVYRCVRNGAIDLYRKRKRARGGKHLVRFDAYDEESVSVSEDRAFQVEDDYSVGEEAGEGESRYPAEVIAAAQQLMQELKLTETELEHIRMRLLDHLPPKEIAELLNITEGAENTRWSRLFKGKVAAKWTEHPVLVEFNKKMQRRGVTK